MPPIFCFASSIAMRPVQRVSFTPFEDTCQNQSTECRESATGSLTYSALLPGSTDCVLIYAVTQSAVAGSSASCELMGGGQEERSGDWCGEGGDTRGRRSEGSQAHARRAHSGAWETETAAHLHSVSLSSSPVSCSIFVLSLQG